MIAIAPVSAASHLVLRGLFFFFSSRRRHTRCLSDWSSDVCSSDLGRRDGRGLDAWLGSALRLRRTPRWQAPAGTTTAPAPGLVTVTGPLRAPAPLRDRKSVVWERG